MARLAASNSWRSAEVMALEVLSKAKMSGLPKASRAKAISTVDD
jgi:hypothetical protein